MSEWPENMTVAPIREWPGALTPESKRRSSPFTRQGGGQMPLSDTVEVLERELRMMKAGSPELLVAISADQFRRDGKPRAQAKAEHPGVILSFVVAAGTLSYPCDEFDRWQDNLRANTLALEALRKVDRYGVTKHGEQYRGFLAIESGSGKPASFATSQEATDYLRSVAHLSASAELPTAALIRRAKRYAHPDTEGGDISTFQRVNMAEEFLKAHGSAL